MSLKIAEATLTTPQSGDSCPLQRDGDDTPYRFDPSTLGGGLQLPIQDGRYYIGPTEFLDGSDSIAETDGILFALPFAFGEGKTWTRIGVQETAGGALDAIRVGVYADSNGLPGARILDAGELSLASPGFIEATISQALDANTVYWRVGISNAATGTAAPTRVSASGLGGFVYGLQDDGGGTLSSRIYPYRSVAYGALPASFGTPDGFLSAFPLIWLRTGV